jgi:hypothetical protein
LPNGVFANHQDRCMICTLFYTEANRFSTNGRLGEFRRGGISPPGCSALHSSVNAPNRSGNLYPDHNILWVLSKASPIFHKMGILFDNPGARFL